ncbi:MAG: glycosyl transferase group 1 [Frankiales bacterium]|nr:glycosyl transferase group 1 [Frankiales bacterium]
MERRLRVLLDGRALTDSSAFRGIGTYVREVVAGLATTEGLDLSVLCSRKAVLPSGAGRVPALRIAPPRWQAKEHDLLLPLDLRRAGADVVFSPALDPPSRCAQPWVQTLHDTWPVLAGDDGASAGRWRRQAERYRKAAAVIAVSSWSAQGAVDLLGLDPSRVHVVPHGVSRVFHPGEGPADPPYVLFVGEYDPRKRHAHAFAAIGALAEQGLPHRLVVTGRIAPWFAGRMDELVAQSPRPDRIELRGHVGLDELVRLYQGAAALLVTSEGEGFGFPALEAMASGAPVIAYDNSATTEVVGDGGVLVPDGDLDALVASLTAVLTEPSEQQRLREAGLARAAAFSWEASVARHAAILRSVAR